MRVEDHILPPALFCEVVSNQPGSPFDQAQGERDMTFLIEN